MQGPARREYLAAIHGRYRGASRREKGQILDEFCRVTGYHRKYALRRLNAPTPSPARSRRRRGVPTYGPATVQALRVIWEAAGYPWSVRLTALLPRWLPWARRRLGLSAPVCAQLPRISPRQIDRLLAPHKRRLKRHRYGGTKPGTLLKHHIAIKAERWDVTGPGFTESDLVAHCGSRGDGEFAHSLNVTDLHTTWVETRAVLGRGEIGVQQALEDIRRTLPFRLRGIDSDNGSEFINDHLFRYCQSHTIEFTRGWADTRIHGTTKRQVAAMFAEERPTLLPLPVAPFRYYQFGTRTVHLDGCVEVEYAYYAPPPGWIGHDLSVQWDGLHVRILDPASGTLLREHRRTPPGRHAIHPADQPARTPPTTLTLLAQAARAGAHIGTLCDTIHRRDGQLGVRRILGVLGLVKKHGPAVVEDACTAALELQVADYRFVRRYLERHPAAPLTLRQVDPLIRDLTHYRDLITRKAQEEIPT